MYCGDLMEKGKGKGGKLEQLNSGLDICCILNSIFDDILPSTSTVFMSLFFF